MPGTRAASRLGGDGGLLVVAAAVRLVDDDLTHFGWSSEVQKYLSLGAFPVESRLGVLLEY